MVLLEQLGWAGGAHFASSWPVLSLPVGSVILPRRVGRVSLTAGSFLQAGDFQHRSGRASWPQVFWVDCGLLLPAQFLPALSPCPHPGGRSICSPREGGALRRCPGEGEAAPGVLLSVASWKPCNNRALFRA